MSQKQNVPEEIMNFYLGCGMERNWIEKCWIQSGFSEQQIHDLIFQPQNNQVQIQHNVPQNDNDCHNFEISKLEKHVSKIIQQIIRKTPRKANNFVGIENLENDSILNIMLQLIHQIPQLYDILLRIQCNNQNKQGQFLRCIQLLLTQLTVSNSSFISSKQILNAAIWNIQDKQYFEIQKDPIIVFFNLLTTIDQSYMELNKQISNFNGRKENFFIKEFNILFNSTILINQNQEKVYILVTEMKQSSIYSFLYEQYKQKVSVLPQILCIQIKRNQNNKIRIEKIFDVNQVLELEFMKINYHGSQEINQINQQQSSYNIEKIQKDLSNFSNSIQMFTEDGNQQDIIRILKSQQITLEKQLQQKHDAIQKQKQALESSFHENNTKYAVYSIAIQKGYSSSNSSILYVYNFKNRNWLKFSNSICLVVEEEEVTMNSKKHALFVTYINTNQIPLFSKHQENLAEIGNKISTNIMYELNQNQYLKSLIPNDILMEAYNNNLKNVEQFGQLY